MELEQAAEHFGVKPDLVNHFYESDPFNEGNRIEGYLCRQGDHRYGALLICRVNGHAVEPQTVWATPKLRYPFGRTEDGAERHYHWPKFVKVEVYEKIDGTNVLQYAYKDVDCNWFVTYKTRLTPVLRAGRFGDFVTLWRDALPFHPEIVQRPSRDITHSYELYGARNHVLVRYEVPIAIRHLFDVDQRGPDVYPPNDVEPVATATSSDDLVSLYEAMRDRAQAENTKVNAGNDDEYIEGSEGYVFYVLTTDGRWEMFKAKPEMVEASHWATGGIPKSIIMPTVWNSLETSDVLSMETVCEMLREEFSVSQVEKSKARVDKCIGVVSERLELQSAVRNAYQKSGLDYAHDGKVAVMRYLSQHIDRAKMKQAFGCLVDLGIAARD